MRPVARTLLAFVVGRAVFGLVFLMSALGRWRVPWYLPLRHRWELASTPSTLGMDWYGRSALSLSAGLVAGLCAWRLAAWTKLTPWLSRPAVVVGIARLGGTMLFFDIAFYGLSLLTRDIDPIALPAWYCPR